MPGQPGWPGKSFPPGSQKSDRASGLYFSLAGGPVTCSTARGPRRRRVGAHCPEPTQGAAFRRARVGKPHVAAEAGPLMGTWRGAPWARAPLSAGSHLDDAVRRWQPEFNLSEDDRGVSELQEKKA